MSVIAKAAALWGLDPARITLAAERENAVYRARGAEGSFALRLHRPGYRSEDELRSELDWMAALAAGGMAVPRPIPAVSGRLIEMVDGTAADLLTWLNGCPAGKSGQLEDITDRPGYMNRLGKALAQLHDLSDGWTPPPGFTRPRWDRAGLVGDAPLWGPFWDNPDLTARERAVFEAARAAADAHLARIEGMLDFGLIHADAIADNVMIDGQTPYLIDFDDGGWGFRDFELATVLMRQIREPDYPALRTALLEGYAARRAVDARVLDLFILLRALTYPGWTIPRMHEPSGRARSARAIATAVPLAQTYLERGPHDRPIR